MAAKLFELSQPMAKELRAFGRSVGGETRMMNYS